MPAAHLPERGVIRIAGPDARGFLQGLVTCNMDLISPEKAGYGALLSPQGKIIADFLIAEAQEADGGGFFLDCLVTRSDMLVKRLRLYKLKAQVSIDDLSEMIDVIVSWGDDDPVGEEGLAFEDPRLAALGRRALIDKNSYPQIGLATPEDWNNHRIGLGVPDGGKDFSYDDAFPHEALLDQLNGVDFRKGCYVGQEVVSRMEHRGTARTRIVPIVFDEGISCEWGLDAYAGGRIIGRVGSTGLGRGLALLRLDRVREALAGGETLKAGGISFSIEKVVLDRFSAANAQSAPAICGQE